MENRENIRIGYYVRTYISEGHFMDDQIGVLSGRLDELCIPVVDSKQHKHIGRILTNDFKEYAEEDYRKRHGLTSVAKGQ